MRLRRPVRGAPGVAVQHRHELLLQCPQLLCTRACGCEHWGVVSEGVRGGGMLCAAGRLLVMMVYLLPSIFPAVRCTCLVRHVCAVPVQVQG